MTLARRLLSVGGEDLLKMTVSFDLPSSTGRRTTEYSGMRCVADYTIARLRVRWIRGLSFAEPATRILVANLDNDEILDEVEDSSGFPNVATVELTCRITPDVPFAVLAHGDGATVNHARLSESSGWDPPYGDEGLRILSGTMGSTIAGLSDDDSGLGFDLIVANDFDWEA